MNRNMQPTQPVFDPNNIGESMDVINERIVLKAPQLEGIVAGEALSFRTGDGFEIDGLREYVPGDDTRMIDWNATARNPEHELQVRERYREITPSLWVVTDVLQQRYAANRGLFSEQRLGLSAITTMLQLAAKQGLPFGAIAANDTEIRGLAYGSPVSGRNNLLGTVNDFVDKLSEPQQANSLPDLLSKRGESEAKRPRLTDLLNYASHKCVESVVVVVSDFRDTADPYNPNNGWASQLQQLHRQRNDIIAIETTNPYDFALPEHVTRFASAGKVFWIGADKDGKAQREKYAKAAAEQQNSIQLALESAHARRITLSTDDPEWANSFKEQLRSA